MSIWSPWFFHGSSSPWWGMQYWPWHFDAFIWCAQTEKEEKDYVLELNELSNCHSSATLQQSKSTCWHFAFGTMLSQQRNPCTDCKCAQQCTTRGHPYHSPKLHMGPCSSVGMQWGTRQTLRHRQPWPLYISPLLYLTRNVTNWCHWTPKRLHKHSSSRAPILQTSTFMTA